MTGTRKGFLGTLVTGMIVIAMVYTLLKYNKAVFQTTAGSGGLVRNYQKFARVAQGAQ